MTYKLDVIAAADLPTGKLSFNPPVVPDEPLPENAYAAYNAVACDLEEMLNES